MADKKSWRDYLPEKTENQDETSGTKKSSWRDYVNYSQIVGENINDQMNAWLKNYNSYVSDYQDRFSGRTGTYEDAYVSDSADWLSSTRKRKKALDAEADAILDYLNQYGGHLDSKTVEEIQKTLTEGKSNQKKILDISKSDNDYWSQWGGKAADTLSLLPYAENFNFRENAYKKAQEKYGYSKKYEGMTHDELQNALSGLGDGNEKEWLTSYAASVDYDEKSKYDVSAGEYEIKSLEDKIKGLQNYHTMGYEAAVDHDYSEGSYDKFLEEWFAKYGGPNAMLELIENEQKKLEEKKQYHESAKKVQESIRIAEEWNRYTKEADFDEYAAKGAAIENPSFEEAFGTWIGPWQLGGEDIGNIVTFSRDNYNNIASSEGGTVGNLLYNNMTEDEVKLYNYLLAKEGKEVANSYLSYLEPALKDAEGKRIADRITGIDIPVIEDLMVLGTGFGAGVENWYNSAKSFFTGDEISPSILQSQNAYIGESLDGKFGQYAHQAATTIGNMAPSILVSTVLGGAGAPAALAQGVGAATMGVSAAGGAYSDALAKGYGKASARAYSTLVGASEGILQYLIGGIGSLGGVSGKVASKVAAIDSSLLRAAAKLGVNIGGEILEEELQNYLEPAFRTIIFGEDYDAPTIDEIIETAIVTALSTGVLEGGEAIGSTVAEESTKKLYAGSSKELIQEGLLSDVNSESYKLAQQYKQKIDGGKTLTGAEIRQLVEANEKQISIEDFRDATSEAKAKLKTLGETENVDKIAKLVAKRVTGQELTRAEKSTLARSQYGAQVAKELREVNQTESGAKSFDVAYKSDATYKPLESRVDTETPAKVSNTGKAVIEGTNKAVDLTHPKIKQISNDSVTLDVDGKEVNIDDIEFANEDQWSAFNALKKIEHITPLVANDMIAKVDLTKPVWSQMNGLDEAFTYGYWNYSEADLKAGLFTGNLTKEQLNDAYKLGQYVRQNDVEADETNRVKMRTEAEAKISEKEKAKKQKARIESDDVDVYFMDGKRTVKFDDRTGKYDNKRTAAINTAKFLKKLGIGGKFVFYESYEKNGKRYYKDANGKEKAAPNGFYDPADGSIYIDLNAGNDGSGTALFTMGHELAHFIKHHSEKQFKILSNLVTEAFDNTDVSMRERVLAKQKFLEEVRGKEVHYTEAYEEVVADAMSTMLTDGSFYDMLMEIRVKDKGLFATIKKFFTDMIAKFKEEYKGLTPDQQDAQDIRELKDCFDKIQKAFAEGLVEASENFQAAQEAQKNTTEDGGVKMQTRTVAGNKVVWIEDNILKENNGIPTHQFIANYIAEHINDVYTIIESGQKVYIGEDLPGEYTQSKYTQTMLRNNRNIIKAKNRASANLGEMIEIATNRRWEKADHTHNKDAKYGIYRYDTAFGFPVKNTNGDITGANIYKAELIIRNASDGKKYLYDIVSIKKDTASSDWLTQRVTSAAEKTAGQKSDAFSKKIAQDSTNVNTKSTEAMDIEVDAKTESVSPSVLKSERTWTSSDYVQERDKSAKEIAKAIGVTEQKAKDYIDSVNSIAKMIAEDRSRLDYFSSPNRTSFVGNVEYGGSFDFSTLCKKRRLLTGTFTAIQKALPNTALTADEILDIRNRMKEANLEVSCGLCYVEGSRANMGQFSKEFLRLYKQYYPDAWQPNMVDVNTPDGVEWMRINHPEAYEQYEYFWNHYGTLKDGDKNLFASQQKPKLYQLHTEYKGEILDKFKDDDNVEEKNLNGGIRLQSFSDFEIVHLIDTMQIIMDMSRVGLAGQAYTKVPDFAWALGDTGLKINLSLIAKGVDENGKLIFDDVEGMPIAEAMKLRDRYSKNVGTILVAFNDEQLLAAMADERVDFIIPFHRSQWKKSQYEAMGLPAKTKDYTFMQNEKYIKPQFHEYRGRMVKDKATNYMPNEYWDFSKSGKENAEAYLEMCARNNKRPKFYKLLQNNGDGSYSLKADGSTDGYWKLLIDFKMYDNEGAGSPQMAVKPEFNMEEANRMLNDYKGGHSNFPVAQGIVDGFVKDYKASHKGQKFSERDLVKQDRTYLDAVNRGDTETAQKMVDEAAREWSEGNEIYTTDPETGEVLFKFYRSADGGRTVWNGHGNNQNQGVFLTSDPYIADAFDVSLGIPKGQKGGQHITVYAKAENPFVIDANGRGYTSIPIEEKSVPNWLYEASSSDVEWSDEANDYVTVDYIDIDNLFPAAFKQGHDAVIVTNVVEGVGGGRATDVVLKDGGKQMKSADPITYDDNGNVIPLSERFNAKNDDIRYSERGNGTSNRSLLANAFEGITQSSIEYKAIQEYKGQINKLNKLDMQLSRLNSRIREIRFGKGKYNAEKLQMLENKRDEIAAEINKQDKVLISLEASEPLRKLIASERKKEAQKTKEHVNEILQNKKARVEQTELRHKIRKTVRDLDKILNHGNKKQNVKEDMKGFVSKALDLADYLFTDHISNDDLIRRGIDPSLIRGEREARLVKETEEILFKLYDDADSLTDKEFARLDDKRKANEEKLRDLLKAQRNKVQSTPVYNLFNDLVIEYTSLKNSKQDAVKAAYNDKVEEHLRTFLGNEDSDRAKVLQNMRVADMTTEELWKLYNAYTMVLTTVRDANKFHVQGMNQTIEQVVGQISSDFSSRKIPEKKLAIAAQKIANKIGWDYEKLYYALDRIGSDAFTKLITNLADSENIVMQDVIEAIEFRDQIVEKYGFNNWAVNKEINREFLDNTGKKFKMTLGQMMSLYAYSRRAGAWDHIEYGGFVFGEAALTNPRPADSYKLTKNQVDAITSLLTKEQKGYVEAMQKFLSETMGAKGNEVSMKLYGIKMFGEKNYFPIHIAGQFKAQADESQAKAAAGFQSMSNAGFTNAQNPNAKAPFVLEGFNEIWSDHVNEMSRYHGTVPALEDIRRVMNRSTYMDAMTESQSIKQLMENQYGKEAVEYFNNLYREANSGAITDRMQKPLQKLLGFFRKNSVAYSLSVVIQQPSAMSRAYAMIDKKYFGFKGVGALTSGVAKAVSSKWNPAYANAYSEMKKYAPGVTMAKEIGGFDTHTGTSIRQYLLDTGKSLKQSMKTENLKGKGSAVLGLVDDNAIANLPSVSDKIAWIEIWNACKRETLAKHKTLAPTSEEFMQIVGNRFTEVIRATQVYDSMFSKSPMLKSKRLAVQYVVSFMNEPNTTVNMVEKAVRDVTKGDWKSGAKTAVAITSSIIFNNVLKSVIYAMRDDDEDETYIEKYAEAIVSGLVSDFNPLSYIPYVRDVLSKLQGYDVERPDMAIVTDAIEAYQAIVKNINKDTENLTEHQIAELDKKVTDASWKLVGSLAAFFGIPVKNIYREIDGVIDHARIASANAGMTTLDSVWDKVTASIPLLGAETEKADKLYEAIVSGDKAYIDRLKSGYVDKDGNFDKSKYESAVRKALRENDPRIKEAAQANVDGNAEKRNRILKELKSDLGSEYRDFIVDAINAETSKIRNDSKPEKVTGQYEIRDFIDAVADGDSDTAKDVREDIIDTHIANDKTQTQAEQAFVSSFVSGIEEAYSYNELDKDEAKNLLVDYADMEAEDAADKITYWDFKTANPDSNLAESKVMKYLEFAEPAGVSLDVYEQFVEETKDLKNIKNEWGEVEVTKRAQVLEVIDSLPISWQQKDALYLAAELAESKIWDVPW